jgi:NAD(P)-dependent dehydrogenase (short-subunit alcohol dehydrogenase family)
MKKVCVITGGGSGIGLAAAKILGSEHYIVIAGRTVKKLENALEELSEAHVEAEAFACDIADQNSVNKLAARANELGNVTTVVNAAGVSPSMGDAKHIMEINALGTIHVGQAFYEIMKDGACIVNVSSISAYLMPKFIIPVSKYKLCEQDTSRFFKKVMTRVNLFPKKFQSSISYGISKDFVIWYSKTQAAKYGAKGIRILSVSPGNVATPMGKLEQEEADKYTKYCAIKRFGYAEEVAYLLATCTDERNGYLTGVDILCDGGLVASGISPLRV